MSAIPARVSNSEGRRLLALGRMNRAHGMNRTEAAYAEHLELMRRAGEVAWYGFEVMTLKLADDTRYTPDFLVQLADGALECHEVKGFWRDDARVKVKVAAAMFPFRFLAVTKDGKGWRMEEF